MASKKLSKKSVRRHKRVKGGRNDPQPQPNWSTAQITHQQINDLARILTNEEINNLIQERNSQHNEEINNLIQERNSQHNDIDSDSDENLNLDGNPCLRCVLEQTDNPRYEEACQACRNELYNYDMPQTPPRPQIQQRLPRPQIQQRLPRPQIQQILPRPQIQQTPPDIEIPNWREMGLPGPLSNEEYNQMILNRQTNRQTNRNPFDQWVQGRQTVPLEDQYNDDVDYTFYARENQGPNQDAGKKKKHKKKKTLKKNKKSQKKRNTKKSYKNKKRTRRR